MPRCYVRRRVIQGEKWGEETRNPGPNSPTEAQTAPSSPNYYRNLETATNDNLEEYVPNSEEDMGVRSTQIVSSLDGGIPIFRERSAEETEAAHDLLELSRSLPPLPSPVIIQVNQDQYNSVIHPTSQSSQPIILHVKDDEEDYQAPQSVVVTVSKPPKPLYEAVSVVVKAPESNTMTLTYEQDYPKYHSEMPPPATPYAHQSVIQYYRGEVSNSSDAENSNPNPKHRNQLTKRRKTAPEHVDFVLREPRRRKRKNEGDEENNYRGKFSCTQCGRQYATSSNLSRHKQTHRSLDSHSAKRCNTCGKAYVSMPALAMHLLTHQLAHACGICGKMFSRPWLLQGHLRSHTGEKPYRCGHCGKSFADRSNLRAHMQTHSFEKNYVCLKCKKSFALKSYLSKHLESSCFREDHEEGQVDMVHSPANSMDTTIDVETWSRDGDLDDPEPLPSDEELIEDIVVI